MSVINIKKYIKKKKYPTPFRILIKIFIKTFMSLKTVIHTLFKTHKLSFYTNLESFYEFVIIIDKGGHKLT